MLAACLAGCLAVLPVAQAHDTEADALPASPGLRIGAAAAVSWLDADPKPVPAARYPGWLGSGQSASDRSGAGLEHGAIEAGLRLNRWAGAALAVGKHQDERAHVETARIELRGDMAQLWPGASQGGELRLAVGRNRVPLGGVVDAAGHFDRYALAPLAKRLMLNDDWIDDGLNLAWRGTTDVGLQAVDVGVWRGRKYPGAPHGKAAPALRVQGEWGDLQADIFAAWLAPQGRGAPAASLSAGHSHDLPDCSKSLVGLVCFDGRSHLAGLSASWAPRGWPVQLQGAWLSQLERGALYSNNGDVTYRGRNQGSWADVNLMLAPGWQAGVRLEQVSTRHRLSGPGASSVSLDAGLAPNQAVRRQALRAGWLARPGLRLMAEAGHEQSALGHARWAGLRLIWSMDDMWSASW